MYSTKALQIRGTVPAVGRSCSAVDASAFVVGVNPGEHARLPAPATSMASKPQSVLAKLQITELYLRQLTYARTRYAHWVKQPQLSLHSIRFYSITAFKIFALMNGDRTDQSICLPRLDLVQKPRAVHGMGAGRPRTAQAKSALRMAYAAGGPEECQYESPGKSVRGQTRGPRCAPDRCASVTETYSGVAACARAARRSELAHSEDSGGNTSRMFSLRFVRPGACEAALDVAMTIFAEIAPEGKYRPFRSPVMRPAAPWEPALTDDKYRQIGVRSRERSPCFQVGLGTSQE
ncbi:hypothetical protein B0H11DRAFT_2231867 [Mycena galericulata]|nr:hypothetical protein B0H11DRAFT_2231867 [Mycena galericulata]